MKKKYFNISIAMFIIVTVLIIQRLNTGEYKKELTIGIFAGSYWDVPYSECYGIIDTAIKAFEEDNPGVKVNYINGILKEDYSEWLSGCILNGTAPDVFMILPEDFSILASIGAMKDLDNLIKKDKEFDIEKYYEVSYNAGQYQGDQFALPYESVPTLMFVNTTLLEKENIEMPLEDWTWDDFYNICKSVTKDSDGDGRLDQYGVYDYTWENAIYSNGVNLFNENGSESFFSDSRVEEAIEFTKKLNEINNGYTITLQDFDDGKVVFRPLLFSDYSTYKTYPWKIKKYSNFQWECIKMPAGTSGENISQVSTLLIGINSRTKNEKLAWEFLKLISYNEETQENIFNYSQGISPLKNVTASVEIKNELGSKDEYEKYIDTELIDNVMENSIAAPKFRKYDTVMAMSDTVINQGVNNSENLSYLLLKLQREINEILRN